MSTKNTVSNDQWLSGDFSTAADKPFKIEPLSLRPVDTKNHNDAQEHIKNLQKTYPNLKNIRLPNDQEATKITNIVAGNNETLQLGEKRPDGYILTYNTQFWTSEIAKEDPSCAYKKDIKTGAKLLAKRSQPNLVVAICDI